VSFLLHNYVFPHYDQESISHGRLGRFDQRKGYSAAQLVVSRAESAVGASTVCSESVSGFNEPFGEGVRVVFAVGVEEE